MKKKEGSHDWCDTSFFYLYGRKPVAGKRRRRQLREFAPHSPERLILPLRGANFLQGRGAVGCESLRPAPGKALFFRRGAQTFCREEAPAAAGVCAPFPGKAYFSVERRKPFAGKRRRRLREFAPHSRESLILPLRGANLSPGKAPAAAGVCAPFPGKPYFSVEGRKPFTRKSPRRPWEFAPRSRESLILPSRGANPSPGKSPRRRREFAPHTRESLILPLRGANPSPGKAPRRRREFAPHSRESLILPLRGANLLQGRGAGGCGSLRPIPGKALFFR